MLDKRCFQNEKSIPLAASPRVFNSYKLINGPDTQNPSVLHYNEGHVSSVEQRNIQHFCFEYSILLGGEKKLGEQVKKNFSIEKVICWI